MASEPGSSAAPPAAPPAGQQAEEPAGAEFFRRRLQRAMAIPPEQRDPAVHAFVTSVQLLNAADELPLTADGQPALPADTLAGQQAEVQAFALAAKAFHVGADTPEDEGQRYNHLHSYLARRSDQVRGRWDAACQPALQPLGQLLLRCHSGFYVEYRYGRRAWTAVLQALGQPETRRTVSQQLEQLQHSSGLPPLTLEQMEALLHSEFAACGVELINHWEEQAWQFNTPAEAAADFAEVSSTTFSSGQRLAALEPESPRALLRAALAAHVAAPVSELSLADCEERMTRRSLDLHMQALRAAQAQGSGYWAVMACAPGLSLAVEPHSLVRRGDLAALVAAAEAVPAVVQRLSGVLPQSWLAALREQAAAAEVVLPVARQLLRLQGRGSAATRAQASQTALGAVEARLAGQTGSIICSGCGKEVASLPSAVRRCAHCKQAAYCSRDCQVRHWRQHKRDCNALGTAAAAAEPEAARMWRAAVRKHFGGQ